MPKIINEVLDELYNPFPQVGQTWRLAIPWNTYKCKCNQTHLEYIVAIDLIELRVVVHYHCLACGTKIPCGIGWFRKHFMLLR